jgi:hypothetical protein
VLSRSGESTPDLSLIPPHLKSIQFGFNYEQWIIHTLFFAYNILSIRVLFRFFTIGCSSIELIHPLSLSIPIIFLISPKTHIQYLCLGVVFYLLWEVFQKSTIANNIKEIFKWQYSLLVFIFFLGLALRLWYANYLASFGEFGLGFGADGHAYYKSALAFSKGNYGDVDYWFSPFYAFYLSLFGEGPEKVFYSQAVLGAFVPVVVFMIGRLLFGNSAALWAGLLTAVSHLCIHYSVVVNRSTPMTLTVALLTYLCLKSKNKNLSIIFVSFGFLAGATFYFGQESIFAFFALLIILFRNTAKNSLASNKYLKKSSLIIIGVLLATIPMNLIFFHHNDRFIPLGRDKPNTNISTSTFTYSGNPYALKLVKMGFNPIKKTKKSVETFLQEPIKVTQLLLGKLFSEMPGFILDPGGVFLAPLHLSFESFYGAHIEFYLYLFLIIGFLIFLFNKRFDCSDKVLIVGQMALYCIFSSVIIMGTFRFRAPIAPLSMLLLGFCLSKIPFKNHEAPLLKADLFKPERWNFFTKNLRLNPKFTLLGSTILISTFLIIGSKVDPIKSQSESIFTISQWTEIGNQQLRSTQSIKLNTTVFAFYEKTLDSTEPDSQIVFNMCRFLMPGEKPFYRLAIDGQFIGPPKTIQSGCSKVSEPFEPKYDVGIINFYVYFTNEERIGETKLEKFSLTSGGKKESLTIPVIEFNLNEKENNYKKLFENYSWGFVKINHPQIQGR